MQGVWVVQLGSEAEKCMRLKSKLKGNRVWIQED